MDLVRKIKEFSVKSISAKEVEGEVKMLELPVFRYTGRKMTSTAIVEEIKKRNDLSDDTVITIVSHKAEDKVYKCSWDKFLEIAEEVTEDEMVEEDQE